MIKGTRWLFGGPNATTRAADIYVNTDPTFNANDYAGGELPEGVMVINRTGDLTFSHATSYIDDVNIQTGVNAEDRIQSGYDPTITGIANRVPLELAELILPNLSVIRDVNGSIVDVSGVDRIGYRLNSDARFITVVGYGEDGKPAWDDDMMIMHIPAASFSSPDASFTFSNGAIVGVNLTISMRLSDYVNSEGQRVRWFLAVASANQGGGE